MRRSTVVRPPRAVDWEILVESGKREFCSFIFNRVKESVTEPTRERERERVIKDTHCVV